MTYSTFSSDMLKVRFMDVACSFHRPLSEKMEVVEIIFVPFPFLYCISLYMSSVQVLRQSLLENSLFLTACVDTVSRTFFVYVR